MLSLEEELMIKKLAYVPEHTVSLIKIVSGGEPFFQNGFLYFEGPYWVILVGYPLSGEFCEDRIVRMVSHFQEKRNFDYIWVIAPHIPEDLRKDSVAFKKDYYYTLDLHSFNPPKRLLRQVEKAMGEVSVRVSEVYTSEHRFLSKRFVEEKEMDPFVKALYESMGTYLSFSNSALIIDAYDSEKRLVAFYVIETEAEEFLTYVLGCRRTDIAPPFVSDVIFVRMIELAAELKKRYVHLGLGVNEGIRRFKEKWGGIPKIPYEFAELTKKRSFLNIMETITNIL
jgi:hypothetical protein